MYSILLLLLLLLLLLATKYKQPLYTFQCTTTINTFNIDIILILYVGEVTG